jgi:hypothetical protein
VTPALKKIVILGLASGLGNMIIGQIDRLELDAQERELIQWNSEEIIKAGDIAIKKMQCKN